MKRFVLGIAGITIAVLVIIGLVIAGMYNRMVSLSQAVDKQWSQVQNVYQRRADLVPNLVQTVSGAANFEKSTLMEITQARASVGQVKVPTGQAPAQAAELEQYQRAQDQLSGALSRLLVVVERYPELKANSNFLNLQAQLEGTENRISVERGRFNDSVQAYNTAIKRFPTILFARLFGYDPKPYFTATPGSEAPPKVEFNFGTSGKGP